MSKQERRFADDGWAIWIDGDDTSTVYINDWINPKGKSFIDIAIRICGIKSSKRLSVYIPFSITEEEITDVSLLFDDKNILQAIFSASCIIDYKKNEHASEIAYNGKTIDIVHISTMDYQLSHMSEGTLLVMDLEKIHTSLDNDEAYIVWRMPHKTLDEVFRPKVNVKNIIGRLIDLVTTPVVSEKYGYSIRINESRLLPEEVTKIGAFHRQKLKKAVVTISIDENYDINDANCYRIRRLEENLYNDYLPVGYKCDDVITYQWNQTRDDNFQGHFNFYNGITREAVNGSSMSLYMAILLAIAVIGEILAGFVKYILKIPF